MSSKPHASARPRSAELAGALPSGASCKRIVRDGHPRYIVRQSLSNLGGSIVLTESDILALADKLGVCGACGSFIADGECECR